MSYDWLSGHQIGPRWRSSCQHYGLWRPDQRWAASSRSLICDLSDWYHAGESWIVYKYQNNESQICTHHFNHHPPIWLDMTLRPVGHLHIRSGDKKGQLVGWGAPPKYKLLLFYQNRNLPNRGEKRRNLCAPLHLVFDNMSTKAVSHRCIFSVLQSQYGQYGSGSSFCWELCWEAKDCWLEPLPVTLKGIKRLRRWDENSQKHPKCYSNETAN